MKNFYLQRDRDVSGTSGIGIVADGTVFSDGTAVLHWRGSLSSTAVYKSIKELEQIHGHEGATKIVWI